MTDPMPQPSRLAALVDLVLQFRDDESLPALELRRRDRAIGRDLADLRAHPREQIQAWLGRVRAQGTGSPGLRVARVHAASSLVLALVGLALGWAAATTVFHYDGSHPVNVIRVLAVFVFAQLALLLFLGILLAPPSISGRLPGMRGLQDLLSLLSPGRLIRLGGRFLPPAFRSWLEESAGRGQAHQRLFGGVQQWTMLAASQGFAAAFNLGALAGCLGLVAFSDLAFSWNTTLRIEPETFHRVTTALAAPWAPFAPQADPSLDLIQATRYFRLHEGVLPDWVAAGGEDPAELGGWWPFLAACMVFYGLLPRLVLWFVAHWRLRAAVDSALLHLPGVPVLLGRLNHELVETGSPEPDAAAPGSATPDPVPSGMKLALGGPEADVIWAGAPDHGLGAGARHHAGGIRSITQDEEVIAALCEPDGESIVRIRVKAWEPPVTEFLDFVTALRGRLSARRPILIEPAGPSPGQPPSPRHLQAWVRRIHRLGDPWTTVDSPPQETEADPP